MPGISYSALSEHGLRPENDDAFFTGRIGDYVVCAVADGVPEHPDGAASSRAAVDAFRESLKGSRGTARELLVAAVRKADAAVGALSGSAPRHAGLATTLTACLIDPKNTCTLLDISGKNAIVINGATAEYAAAAARSRRPATRPATSARPPEPSLAGMVSHVLGAPYRLKESDPVEFVLGDEYLLIASDGLTDHLNAGAIAAIVRDSGGSPDAACERLVQEAMRVGSESTITVVLVHGTGA